MKRPKLPAKNSFPVKMIVFAAIFALIGVGLLFMTRAATPSSVIEPEDGVKTGNYTLLSDASYSNGGAIQFNAPPAQSGGYNVVGNLIKNASGGTVQIHGVARPSLEWQCDGAGVAGGSGIPASDFSTMKNGWNANAVRLALNQDFWLSGAARYCSAYQATVDAAVKAARAQGMIVILDLHWSDQNNLGNTSPDQQCMADTNSLTFWQQVATKYKSDSGVWFEMYNEPQMTDWNLWLNGGTSCGFTSVGMQQMYNTIRGTGAQNIVIATGTGWGSHLDGVMKLTGTNIVYGIHPYAADSNGGSADNWSTGDWDARFGFLTATAPVIATEFGNKQCGSTYDKGIMDYFKAKGVGFTAWAWYVGGCNFPSIITDAAGTCVNTMGCTTKQYMLAYPWGL